MIEPTANRQAKLVTASPPTHMLPLITPHALKSTASFYLSVHQVISLKSKRRKHSGLRRVTSPAGGAPRPGTGRETDRGLPCRPCRIPEPVELCGLRRGTSPPTRKSGSRVAASSMAGLVARGVWIDPRDCGGKRTLGGC